MNDYYLDNSEPVELDFNLDTYLDTDQKEWYGMLPDEPIDYEGEQL